MRRSGPCMVISKKTRVKGTIFVRILAWEACPAIVYWCQASQRRPGSMGLRSTASTVSGQVYLRPATPPPRALTYSMVANMEKLLSPESYGPEADPPHLRFASTVLQR